MAFISDAVLDAACQYLTANADRLYLCSQEPTTFTEATSTYALGNKTGITVSSPANGDVSGRKVTVSAITDGSVTGTGTATYNALVDFGSNALLVTRALSSSQAVTSGNTFTTDAQDIEFPDPS